MPNCKKPLFLNPALLFTLILHLLALPLFSADKKILEQRILSLVSNGTVILDDESGHRLISHRADELFIPASTIKILTSAISLDLLGSDYRFRTEFFKNKSGEINIRGWGDPYLISEEIDIIADSLKKHDISQIGKILLDHSKFAPSLQIPGISYTANPYDALNGALVTNFNTLNVGKNEKGVVFSAEDVTPLTPLALAKAKALKPGAKERFNLSANPQDCQTYAGELFCAILKKDGISVNNEEVSLAPVDSGWELFYTHKNSRDLTEINRGLLKYSNNFIANQLFLTVGAEKLGYPATLEKGKTVFEDYIRSVMKIPSDQLIMHEGSGISRSNKVTGNVMIEILENRKEQLSGILPSKHNALVKSGTLSGVSNYAGYIQTEKGLRPFVIMLNQKSANRDKILNLLIEYSR